MVLRNSNRKNRYDGSEQHAIWEMHHSSAVISCYTLETKGYDEPIKDENLGRCLLKCCEKNKDECNRRKKDEYFE
jgi:hypothetical protein